MRVPLRLQTRYAIVIVTLIIGIVATLAGTQLIQFRSSLIALIDTSTAFTSTDLQAQMQRRGELAIRLLAESLVIPLSQHDTKTIHKLLATVKRQTDVQYVHVYDPEGRIIHDGKEETPPLGEQPTDAASWKAARTKDLLLSRVENDALVLSLPLRLGATPLGGVKLGLSLKSISHEIALMESRLKAMGQKSFHRTIFTVAITTLGLIALGIVLAVLAARHLSHPIRELAVSAREVGQGNYDVKISSRRSDEIGELAQTFNHMLSRLRDYRIEVERHRHTLEEQVEQRTGELQVALSNAYEFAHQIEEANRSKAQFLADMSYEIRTSMSGVMGMNELLTPTELTNRQRGFVKAMHRSGEALLAFINDLLDFTMIEAGQLELERADFDLHRTLEEMMAPLTGRARDKGLELACHLSPDVPATLCGDPHRLGRILTNLTDNAIKFTKRGKVTVQVAVVEKREGEVLLRFAVSDTGIGIPYELQERIFDFSSATDSTAGKYGDPELGLVVAKQLVEAMGGEIGAESEPDKGSTFWFTVPLEKQTASTQGVRVPEPKSVQSGARTLFPGHVLLVEDNTVNQEVARAMLENLDCQVDTVTDGQEAVEAHGRKSYNLIFMDCQMPEMDGYEATRRIRERERANAEPKHVPIIALTAHALEEDRQWCLSAGMDDYLSKPCTQEQLRDMLERWLPRQAAPDKHEEETALS